MDRDLPEGVIDAEPAGGWDPVGDGQTSERNAQADDVDLQSDAALQPDDPQEGEAARRGADPDLAADADAREEP